MTESLVYRAPQILLDELGITDPGDIDVEAIAEYISATVVYERLQGCEARIVGTKPANVAAVQRRREDSFRLSPRRRRLELAGRGLRLDSPS